MSQRHRGQPAIKIFTLAKSGVIFVSIWIIKKNKKIITAHNLLNKIKNLSSN